MVFDLRRTTRVRRQVALIGVGVRVNGGGRRVGGGWGLFGLLVCGFARVKTAKLCGCGCGSSIRNSTWYACLRPFRKEEIMSSKSFFGFFSLVFSTFFAFFLLFRIDADGERVRDVSQQVYDKQVGRWLACERRRRQCWAAGVVGLSGREGERRELGRVGGRRGRRILLNREKAQKGTKGRKGGRTRVRCGAFIA
ncbi:hypothetical protein F5B18DRAFT_581094 [Nemania serpens]|nr:hypothetical protein F5B18DRAFT_581094 [Nemania serpens]